MSTPEKEAARAWILVVEDSSVFREMQGLLLRQAGYEVSAHESPQTALEAAEKQHFDLVIIDYELPQMNGQQFMHALQKIQPEVAVIFVSGSLTLELAIQLSSQGVAGIFNKPANPKTLLEKVNETLARSAARDTAARIGSGNPLAGRGSAITPTGNLPGTEPASDALAFNPRSLAGSSAVFRDFTHRLWKVRDFRSVLLLQGERGSPFELLARDLVEISIFRQGPVMICPAGEFESRRLIEVLAPSLLSHDAGTLIVRGVEEFTSDQQTMLLNLISGRDVFLPFARRFRLVLAATGHLSDRVDDGSFDETLYYKISSLSVSVPSLREMPGDIAATAQAILAAPAEGAPDTSALKLAPEALDWLESQEWPENYEQLCHTVLTASAHAQDGLVTMEALAAVLGPAAKPRRELGTSSPRPEVAVAPPPPEDTRPPFPISSDLAAEATAPKLPEDKKPAAPVTKPDTGKATAAQLFARPAAAVPRPIVATSHFRPASAGYQFAKRLQESLTLADSDAAA